MADEAAKPRGMMAIKSKRLDGEWQTLIRMAAKEVGLGIGDFIVEACRERAQAIMKNRKDREGNAEPEVGIPAGIPARPEDVADRLAALVEQMATDAERRDAAQAAQAERTESLVARVSREQSEAARKMRRLARSGGRR